MFTTKVLDKQIHFMLGWWQYLLSAKMIQGGQNEEAKTF